MASILVVEDDQLLGSALKSTFTNAGFTTVWATDGIQALTEAKNTPYNLIFLDIMLPGLSGYEVLKTLKNDPLTKGIPVIMLTNLSQIEEIDRAMEIGALDYVIKSNTKLQDLVALVKNKLGLS